MIPEIFIVKASEFGEDKKYYFPARTSFTP
jgi:hypothetical protein